MLVARMKQIMGGLLNYVQHDYDTSPEKETLLYHMFYGMKDEQFDFYEQAKKLFLRKKTSPRKLTITMEYPKDKNDFPCVVIREPSRKEDQSPLGGFGLPIVDEFGEEPYMREGFTYIDSSKVHMMCFSDNMLESVLIGEVFFTLLRGARSTFENEFISFGLSLGEIIAENNVFPLPILIKNIEIDVQWEAKYASIIKPIMVKRFIIEDAIPFDPTVDMGEE